MNEIYSFPNNVDEFTGAEPLMRWFHGRTSGVYGAAGNAAVSAVPGTMQVEVSDGTGWLTNSNGDGVVWWNMEKKLNGSPLTLTVAAADGMLNRIDRVVVSWETTDYTKRPVIEVLKGTPAGSAVAPALTNTNVKRQISLARISIPAGTLKLTPALITDERLDPEVCGLVSESIEADTSMANAQFQAFLQTIEEELAKVVGGTGFDPAPVRVENIKIVPSAFSAYSASGPEETKLQQMGYTMRAAVTVPGVLSTMFPYVTLSLGDVEAAGVGIANQFDCYSGGVHVYADGKPGATITALTIECRKAVQ